MIFSGAGLPLPDTETTYFGIFPYTKRYIKRLIGKPGDSFYFYGGQLFAVDKEGNDIKELREAPWMQSLEYVPFLSFSGEISKEKESIYLFNQMHKPFGKLHFNSLNQFSGDVFNGKDWIKDQPLAQINPHEKIETFSDILGIRNYAEARLLKKEELKLLNENLDPLEDGILYLQLQHTPSLNYPKPFYPTSRGYNIGIAGYTAIIPLQQHHLNAIMDNLYTARFVVTNEKAQPYMLNPRHLSGSPRFPNVPDGTYEFYFGKLSKINWGGISSKVEERNPLYSREPENVQKLFNMGIEMDLAYSPSTNNPLLFPHRYVYFRDGDLYAMGKPIIKKEDKTLATFIEREKKKQSLATSKTPYVGFKDYGPPMKDGKIDRAFIRTFGVTVPERHYLVLGDNHAMSSDSRIFGFVPEANLQGAPCLIIWPPGDRLGSVSQKPYPFLNLPRLIVWSVIALVALCWYLYHRYKIKQPIFIKKIEAH